MTTANAALHPSEAHRRVSAPSEGLGAEKNATSQGHEVGPVLRRREWFAHSWVEMSSQLPEVMSFGGILPYSLSGRSECEEQELTMLSPGQFPPAESTAPQSIPSLSLSLLQKRPCYRPRVQRLLLWRGSWTNTSIIFFSPSSAPPVPSLTAKYL